MTARTAIAATGVEDPAAPAAEKPAGAPGLGAGGAGSGSGSLVGRAERRRGSALGSAPAEPPARAKVAGRVPDGRDRREPRERSARPGRAAGRGGAAAVGRCDRRRRRVCGRGRQCGPLVRGAFRAGLRARALDSVRIGRGSGARLAARAVTHSPACPGPVPSPAPARDGRGQRRPAWQPRSARAIPLPVPDPLRVVGGGRAFGWRGCRAVRIRRLRDVAVGARAQYPDVHVEVPRSGVRLDDRAVVAGAQHAHADVDVRSAGGPAVRSRGGAVGGLARGRLAVVRLRVRGRGGGAAFGGRRRRGRARGCGLRRAATGPGGRARAVREPAAGRVVEAAGAPPVPAGASPGGE